MKKLLLAAIAAVTLSPAYADWMEFVDHDKSTGDVILTSMKVGPERKINNKGPYYGAVIISCNISSGDARTGLAITNFSESNAHDPVVIINGFEDTDVDKGRYNIVEGVAWESAESEIIAQNIENSKGVYFEYTDDNGNKISSTLTGYGITLSNAYMACFGDNE